jgi:hypothetical protein
MQRLSQSGFRGTSLGAPSEIVEQVNKSYEMPRKFPNISRNIAGIFVLSIIKTGTISLNWYFDIQEN